MTQEKSRWFHVHDERLADFSVTVKEIVLTRMLRIMLLCVSCVALHDCL